MWICELSVKQVMIYVYECLMYVCVVLPTRFWNKWTVCFVLRMCEAKTWEKMYPEKLIRGGYIAVHATDKKISVAAGRSEPPRIWISVAVHFCDRHGLMTYPWRFNYSNRHGYVDGSVAVLKIQPPWICRRIRGGFFSWTTTDMSKNPWRFLFRDRHR